MKKLLSIIFLLIPLTLTAQEPDSLVYGVLHPYDFHLQYLITDPAMMIDVREPFEFRRRRIADAVNIPASGDIDIAADTIDPNTTLYIYCTTESRAGRVATRLYEKGFNKLFLLQGGISFWREEGYETERGRIKRKKN